MNMLHRFRVQAEMNLGRLEHAIKSDFGPLHDHTERLYFRRRQLTEALAVAFEYDKSLAGDEQRLRT